MAFALQIVAALGTRMTLFNSDRSCATDSSYHVILLAISQKNSMAGSRWRFVPTAFSCVLRLKIGPTLHLPLVVSHILNPYVMVSLNNIWPHPSTPPGNVCFGRGFSFRRQLLVFGALRCLVTMGLRLALRALSTN